MAKNSVNDYSSTAGNNTDVQSVNIAEGCAPSNINNALREIMADIADLAQGGVTATSIKAAALTGETATVTSLTIGTYSAVSAARQVLGGAGLTAGGALSSDVTLALDVSDLTATSTVVSSADYLAVYRAAATGTYKVLLSDAVPSSPTVQVFTADGTWTRPTGCRRIKVYATGSGGGGGGADNSRAGGGGGGAGATAIDYIDVTALASETVTVGAAGTAGAATGGSGGAGNASSFGAYAVAAGGAAGAGSTGGTTNAAGGLGGAASAGDIQLYGGDGQSGGGNSSSVPNGGAGGASFWGGGGRGQMSWGDLAGAAGRAYGAGGAGGASDSTTGAAGGAGAGGIVVVEEFY